MTQDPVCPLCETEILETDEKVLIVMGEEIGPELVHRECCDSYIGDTL